MADRVDSEKLWKDHLAAEGQLATAIGRFSMRFCELEKQANHSIWVFLRVPTTEIGMLLTGAIRNISTRLDILSSLINGCRMEPELRPVLNECVAEIRELNGYRNWLLHDAWGSRNPQTNEWLKGRVRTADRYRRQWGWFTAEEIDAKAALCREAQVRLNQAISRYDHWRTAQQPSPGKP